MTEEEVATALHAALAKFEATPAIKRLRVRLRELGAHVKDETEQLRQLQKACRESPEIAAALRDAGFGDVATRNARQVDAETGALVQGFNRMVETHWVKR